jgi:hypothetical protein
MPIKIVKQGDDLYTAEVTPPQGSWKSPHPMPNDELGRKLLSMGCDPVEIRHALLEAGVHPFSSWYREPTAIIRPLLQAALAGEREVPAQKPFTEAWLADALFYYDRMLSLMEVLESADAINHLIPNADMISWAFLRLRRRGWLAIEGDKYGLTPEGRRAVKEIVDRGENSWKVKKLEKWMVDYPPPSDE